MACFRDYQLKEEILQAIQHMGFEEPTKIQELTIPSILESNQDLIALAQTGTGKTGAFGIPSIQKLDPSVKKPQMLVLSPTRELALQSAKELKKFSKFLVGMKSVAVYGGADIHTQRKAITSGCQIVVGTPGRTLDFVQRNTLDLSQVSIVVLDEADEMLKMGFQEDLESILATTPQQKQVLLFSATMPKPIEKIAQNYMKEPKLIRVGERNQGNVDVEHCYYHIHAQDRFVALQHLVDFYPEMYGIIFCRTRNETTEITISLRKAGYHVDVLNGDLSQEQRDRVMQQFRNRDLQILVATDIAARGLDVDDISHIINYTLPDELEVYIHRSGRTGRAGKKGLSLSLISTNEMQRIRPLERMLCSSIEKRNLPMGEEIVKRQIQHQLENVKEKSVPSHIFDTLLSMVQETCKDLLPEEVLYRLLTMMMGNLISKYEHSVDLNERAKIKKKNKKQERNRENRNNSDKKSSVRVDNKTFVGDFVVCQINVGTRNGLTPYRLMGLINQHVVGKKPDFGKIQIERNDCIFEVERVFVEGVVQQVSGKVFEKRTLTVIRKVS